MTPAALTGDIALPDVPEVTAATQACLADILDDLGDEHVHGLAVFSRHRAVPAQVVLAVLPRDVVDDLVDRRLLTASLHALQVAGAPLGWAAWDRLGPQAKSTLAGQLARAWSDVDDLTAAYFRTLEAPMDAASIVEARKALAGPLSGEDPSVVERVAEACFRRGVDTSRRERLQWVRASLDAGHLGAAVNAWHVISAVPHGDGQVYASVLRTTLSGLVGDPALSLATQRDIGEIAVLPPEDAFLAWTLAARSAVQSSAVQQARRFLDQAQLLARFAHVANRALWRLTDAEWNVAAGRPVRHDAYVEALSRWCEYNGTQDWYADAAAVAMLTDLGEYDAARQFLIAVEAAHADARGLPRVCVLGVRLHLEVAEFRISAATETAEQLGDQTLSPLLEAPRLRADLLRLHALTTWTGRALAAAQTQLTDASNAAVSAAKGYQSLIDGHYSRAAAFLRSAMIAERNSPKERWELLGDLVEACVGADERQLDVDVASAERLPEPRSPGAVAARARIRALLSAPFEARDAFARAIQLAGPPLPPIYHARALLAYARRLEQLGSANDADAIRWQAADLLGQQGLGGWQRHAEQLVLDPEKHPVAAPSLQGQYSDEEQRVLRLLLAGRRNKEIAAELFVSLRTVEKLLTAIYRKSGVTSKAALMAQLRSLD